MVCTRARARVGARLGRGGVLRSEMEKVECSVVVSVGLAVCRWRSGGRESGGRQTRGECDGSGGGVENRSRSECGGGNDVGSFGGVLTRGGRGARWGARKSVERRAERRE